MGNAFPIGGAALVGHVGGGLAAAGVGATAFLAPALVLAATSATAVCSAVVAAKGLWNLHQWTDRRSRERFQNLWDLSIGAGEAEMWKIQRRAAALADGMTTPASHVNSFRLLGARAEVVLQENRVRNCEHLRHARVTATEAWSTAALRCQDLTDAVFQGLTREGILSGVIVRHRDGIIEDLRAVKCDVFRVKSRLAGSGYIVDGSRIDSLPGSAPLACWAKSFLLDAAAAVRLLPLSEQALTSITLSPLLPIAHHILAMEQQVDRAINELATSRLVRMAAGAHREALVCGHQRAALAAELDIEQRAMADEGLEALAERAGMARQKEARAERQSPHLISQRRAYRRSVEHAFAAKVRDALARLEGAPLAEVVAETRALEGVIQRAGLRREVADLRLRSQLVDLVDQLDARTITHAAAEIRVLDLAARRRATPGGLPSYLEACIVDHLAAIDMRTLLEPGWWALQAMPRGEGDQRLQLQRACADFHDDVTHELALAGQMRTRPTTHAFLTHLMLGVQALSRRVDARQAHMLGLDHAATIARAQARRQGSSAVASATPM